MFQEVSYRQYLQEYLPIIYMNIRKLLLIAVALRLLVSGLLFHPDIKTIAFQTSFLKKGIVNIYPYLINNKVSLPLKEEFVYFRLAI